jgi:hypothetical protein
MERPTELAAPAVQAWARPVIVVPAFVILSLIGGLFPSFTVSANLYVLAIGGVMAWIGLSGAVLKKAVPGRLTGRWAWWLVPTMLLAMIELTNFMFGSTYPHPTLSVLMDPFLSHYTARAAVYFGWLTGFWGLVRR